MSRRLSKCGMRGAVKARALCVWQVSSVTVCFSRMQVFGIFRDQKVSVDVVATSEISISLTLDPRRAAALTRQP